MSKMSDFIAKHRNKIDETLRTAVPDIGEITDRERQLWVLQDDSLLELARSEGLNI